MKKQYITPLVEEQPVEFDIHIMKTSVELLDDPSAGAPRRRRFTDLF